MWHTWIIQTFCCHCYYCSMNLYFFTIFMLTTSVGMMKWFVGCVDLSTPFLRFQSGSVLNLVNCIKAVCMSQILYLHLICELLLKDTNGKLQTTDHLTTWYGSYSFFSLYHWNNHFFCIVCSLSNVHHCPDWVYSWVSYRIPIPSLQ